MPFIFITCQYSVSEKLNDTTPMKVLHLLIITYQNQVRSAKVRCVDGVAWLGFSFFAGEVRDERVMSDE